MKSVAQCKLPGKLVMGKRDREMIETHEVAEWCLTKRKKVVSRAAKNIRLRLTTFYSEMDGSRRYLPVYWEHVEDELDNAAISLR
jgi:hypothetical protein